MTFLAAMDEDGYAQFASVANLAYRARLDLEETKKAVECLESADENSSDPENDGRRIERVPGGWIVLNAKKYRDLVTRTVIKEQTRMRVARHREQKRKVTEGNAPVTQSNDSETHGNEIVTPSDTYTASETKAVPPTFPSASPTKGIVEGKNSDRIPTSEQSKRIATIFHRRLTTAWTDDEVKAYKKIGTIPEDELAALEKYYTSNWPPTTGVNMLRHDIKTFLNNFSGEVDRAKHATAGKNGHSKIEISKDGWPEWLKTQNQDFVPYEMAQPFMREDFQKFLKAR